MVHVIVVNKDEARDIVLTALREKGYDVATEGVEGKAHPSAKVSEQCSDFCTPEKVLLALEHMFAEQTAHRRLYRFAMGTIEKLMIEKALAKTGGNQLAAARLLGINRNTIRSKIERYGIRVPERGAETW